MYARPFNDRQFVRVDEWIPSGTINCATGVTVLTVFRPSDSGLLPDRHPEFDGLVFDCPGDADAFKMMVGLIRPFRPNTEGE